MSHQEAVAPETEFMLGHVSGSQDVFYVFYLINVELDGILPRP